MIVFSDLHLRDESRDTVFNEVLPGIKAAALADAKKRKEPLGRWESDMERKQLPHVVFLGDWYHLRYQVRIDLQNQVRDTMLDWNAAGIRVILLPGNHDQIDVAGRHALEVFSDLPNVHVLSEPQWTPIGLFVPYRLQTKDLKTALEMPKPLPEFADVAWMHFGLHGAVRNNGTKNDTGLSVSELASFSMVLTGHYHRPQTFGHVFYIGSPYETKSDEGEFPHGFVEYDPDADINENPLTFHAQKWGARTIKLSVGADGKMDAIPEGLSPRDKIIVDVRDPKASLEAMHKLVLERTGIAPIVRPDYLEESTLRLGSQNGLEDYAYAFADKFAAEKGINPVQAKLVFKQVVNP